MSPGRLLGDRRGQLALSALLVLPTLFLFVYLLVETTNLSREKIRHQFALDAGASQEIGLYADLLNRLAYINGPFPDRVFKELSLSPIRYYQDYNMGLFPASFGGVSEDQSRWVMRFGPGRGYLNVDYPTQLDGIFFINQENAGPRMAVFGKIYFLLGDLARSHIKVFDGLTSRHALLRRSMWMNMGSQRECPDPEACGEEAASGFPPLPVTLHYIAGYEDNDDDEKVYYPAPGLFQLATVPQFNLSELRAGLVIRQGWKPGKNYFHVSFDDPQPYVRNTVMVDGGRVWTDPTPKYATSLQP